MTQDFDALVEEIVAGKVSLFDLMRSAPKGDYRAYVEVRRLFAVVCRDKRVVQTLLGELNTKTADTGQKRDERTDALKFAGKNVDQRFSKFINQRAEVLRDQPRMLTGSTFEICLQQYLALLTHVENMWTSAAQLYYAGNYPIATFLSILVVEEIGKLTHLADELTFFDGPHNTSDKRAINRSHRRKHLLGVFAGALINNRLDRVLGKGVIRKLLHDAESDGLERLRQACLYSDVKHGMLIIPAQQIDAERAKTLTTLSGELMAEVLGYFPWEFERMLDKVIAFERSVGLSEEKIARA